MAKRVRKAVKFGAKLVSAAKTRVKKEMDMMMKDGIINKKEAKKLIGAFVKELQAEKERFKEFAKQEAKRELAKAKKHARPLVKRVVKKLRR